MEEITKTRAMFILIIAAVLLTTVYVEFEKARYQSSYPYRYGIKVIHGNTIIDGFDISGHEVGIIVDAPNVMIRDTIIMNCTDGIITTSNANYCIITGNIIDECINGITTDVESGNVTISYNMVRCYDMAFIIKSEYTRVIDNVAYFIDTNATS